MKKLLALIFGLALSVSSMGQTVFKMIQLKNVDTTAFTLGNGQIWYNPTYNKFSFYQGGVVKHFALEGSAFTLSNGQGTTANSHAVDLGGTLSSSKTISFTGSTPIQFNFGQGGAGKPHLQLTNHSTTRGSAILEGYGNTAQYYAKFTADGNNLSPQAVMYVQSNGPIYAGITVRPDTIYISGSTGFRGMEELADYSANYSSLSLINKGYALSKFVSLGGTSTMTSNMVLAPTVSGYSVQFGDYSGLFGNVLSDFTVQASTFKFETSGGGDVIDYAGNTLAFTANTFSFSSALTLPNGSTATTQSAGDNSTKVATTAYVDALAVTTPVSLALGGTGSALSDPGANKIPAWDDTDNTIGFWTIGSGLTYTHSTHTLSASGGGGTQASYTEALAGTDSTKFISPKQNAQVNARVYNVTAYGAKADFRIDSTASVSSSSTALTTTHSLFSTADTGKTILVSGAGAAGADLQTTITYVSATAVTLGVAASTTVSSKRIKWGTDNTAKIQSAINAADAAGGGDVYFPNGQYFVTGPLITSLNGVNPNCQIYFPLHTPATKLGTRGLNTIRLIGESRPIPYINHLDVNAEPYTTGVILHSSLLAAGYVIAQPWNDDPFSFLTADFNFVKTDVENITIRVRSTTGTAHVAPQMGALYLAQSYAAHVNYVNADTESSPDNSVLPVVSTCSGITMPTWNNWAAVVIENSQAQRFYNGIVINECAWADKIWAITCLRGLVIGSPDAIGGSYPSYLGRIFIHASVTPLAVIGVNKFTINQLDIEDYQGYNLGAKWYNGGGYDVVNSSSTSRGVIYTSQVVVAGGNSRPLKISGQNGQIKLINDLSQSLYGIKEGNQAAIPKNYDNLIGWWEADNWESISKKAGVSGVPVSQWRDLSGNDYHWSESSVRPSWARGSTNSGRNSNDFVYFDSQRLTQTALEELKGVNKFTVIAVGGRMGFFQDDGTTSNRLGFGFSTNKYIIYNGSGSNVNADAGTTFTGTPPAPNPDFHVIVWEYDGTQGTAANRTRFRINGTAATITMNSGTWPSTTSSAPTTIRLMQDQGGTFFVGGRIYKLIIIKDILSAADLATIENYALTTIR